eukprot:g7456.t1
MVSNAMLAISLVFLLVFLSESVDQGHVLDTREQMCEDAVNALVSKYNAITSNSVEGECPDIGDYTYPDMCTNPVEIGDLLGYKIQNQTEQNEATRAEICASRGAAGTFREKLSNRSKWGDLVDTTLLQYFGGQKTGLFAQYPASDKTMCWCDDYDPRYQSWYSAAVTGPKDLILVLDVSGSMTTKGRMDIMKKGAIAQLDTMTFLDYIQVRILREYIEGLQPGGQTNGKKGLELAFQIFKDSAAESKTSGCLRIISFLTDGIMTDIDTDNLGWLDTEQNGMVNAGLSKAHIFTYALGSGAETGDMRILACQNRGWMATIKDGNIAGIKHAMTRYYEYFAGKIPISTSSKSRWSEFYIDSSGQGKTTTVSKPVFTIQSGRRVLEGVVGIDVSALDFGENLDEIAMSNALNSRSRLCMEFDFNLADLSTELKNTCETGENETTGEMVPTGATKDAVDDGSCYANPSNTVACPLSGCMYQWLGCSYESVNYEGDVRKVLECRRHKIIGPVNILNIPLGVGKIDLSAHKITNISVGMFDGLTALTDLYLWDNQLRTLPPGIFDGLTATQVFPKGIAAYQTSPVENQYKEYISGVNQGQYPSRGQDIAFFLSMLLPAFGLILGHRRLPERFRHLDVLFSQKHLVEDTHAVRETESRLGAACTIAFAFFSTILLYDGYCQANELVSSSLLYATIDEMKLHKDRSFGELLLRTDFLSDVNCANTTVDISPSLHCNFRRETCEWRCKATSSLSSAYIAFTLPKTTQAFAWNMSVRSWEFQKAGETNYHLVMSMAGIIGPSPNKVLSGTSENPTDVQIDLLRGFSLYNMDVKRESAGLKVLYQLTRRIEETITSASGGEGLHVVRFLFPVSNLVVFEQMAEKLSFQARLTLALSLMTSMMAVMSIGKMLAEAAIDKYHLRRENVPADVTRRQVILKESIITRGGIRRMSSYKTKAPPRPRTISNPLYGIELKTANSKAHSSFPPNLQNKSEI